MVGRKPLIALAASALLFAGSQGSARAADGGLPFEELVQVYVPDQAAVDAVDDPEIVAIIVTTNSVRSE